MKKINCLLGILFISAVSIGWAQPTEQLIKVLITPNHEKWECNVGDASNFKISIVKMV